MVNSIKGLGDKLKNHVEASEGKIDLTKSTDYEKAKNIYTAPFSELELVYPNTFAAQNNLTLQYGWGDIKEDRKHF